MPDPLAMLLAPSPPSPTGPPTEAGGVSADAFVAALDAAAAAGQAVPPDDLTVEAAVVQDGAVAAPAPPCAPVVPQPPVVATGPAASGVPGTEGPGTSLSAATATPGQDAGRPPFADAAAVPEEGPDRAGHPSVAPPDADIPVTRHAPGPTAPQAVPAVPQGPPVPPPAPASPAAASVPPPHAQIAQAIEPFAQGPRSDAPAVLSIRLSPADLGQVEVRIEPVRGGTTRVEIVAERPETMALLQRDQQELLRALDRAGLSTGEPPGFSLAGRQGGAAERQPGERRTPQQGAPAAGVPVEEIATAAPVPARQMHRPAGRIDLIA